MSVAPIHIQSSFLKYNDIRQLVQLVQVESGQLVDRLDLHSEPWVYRFCQGLPDFPDPCSAGQYVFLADLVWGCGAAATDFDGHILEPG